MKPKTLDARMATLMRGGSKVVELGCGTGYALDELCRLYDEAVGVDISMERLDCREAPPDAWQFIRADLNEKFPFVDNSVDAILANQVIEHIQKPVFFATEIHRVLRPGGITVLATPNVRYFPHIWRLAISGVGPKTANSAQDDGWDDGHINYFTHNDLRNIFERAAFSDISTRAMIDIEGELRWLRKILNLCSGAYPVREFASGNALLVARKT